MLVFPSILCFVCGAVPVSMFMLCLSGSWTCFLANSHLLYSLLCSLCGVQCTRNFISILACEHEMCNETEKDRVCVRERETQCDSAFKIDLLFCHSFWRCTSFSNSPPPTFWAFHSDLIRFIVPPISGMQLSLGLATTFCRTLKRKLQLDLWCYFCCGLLFFWVCLMIVRWSPSWGESSVY